MALTFSTAQAESLVGMSQRQVRLLASQQVVEPSEKRPEGPGTVTRYSMEDLIALELVRVMREVCGPKYDHRKLARAVSTARQSSFSGTLVCDGEGAWIAPSGAEQTIGAAAVVVMLDKVAEAAHLSVRRSALVAEAA